MIATALLVLAAAVAFWTPGGKNELMYAAERGELEHVIQLVRDDDDVNAQDDYGGTALTWAVHGLGMKKSRADKLLVIRWLLDHGANPNLWNRSSWPPLTGVALYGRVEDVDEMLKHRADVNATSDSGTALSIALQGQNVSTEVVASLLAAGANVNHRDASGFLPLEFAAVLPGDRTDVVELLLRHGANARALDGQGRLAWQEAQRLGNRKAGEILRRAAEGY